MTKQLDIFGEAKQPVRFRDPHGLYHTADPSTSKRAAEEVIKKGTDKRHEAIIKNGLSVLGKATAKELSTLCGLTQIQISRRTGKMKEDGIIRETGTVRDSAGEMELINV